MVALTAGGAEQAHVAAVELLRIRFWAVLLQKLGKRRGILHTPMIALWVLQRAFGPTPLRRVRTGRLQRLSPVAAGGRPVGGAGLALVAGLHQARG